MNLLVFGCGNTFAHTLKQPFSCRYKYFCPNIVCSVDLVDYLDFVGLAREWLSYFCPINFVSVGCDGCFDSRRPSD